MLKLIKNLFLPSPPEGARLSRRGYVRERTRQVPRRRGGPRVARQAPPPPLLLQRKEIFKPKLSLPGEIEMVSIRSPIPPIQRPEARGARPIHIPTARPPQVGHRRAGPELQFVSSQRPPSVGTSVYTISTSSRSLEQSTITPKEDINPVKYTKESIFLYIQNVLRRSINDPDNNYYIEFDLKEAGHLLTQKEKEKGVSSVVRPIKVFSQLLSINDLSLFDIALRDVIDIDESSSEDRLIEQVFKADNINDISYNKIPKKKTGSKTGNFYHGLNYSKFNLKRYQIYTREELLQQKEQENCFLHTMRMCGCTDKEINHMMLSNYLWKNGQVSTYDFNKFCIEYNIRLSVDLGEEKPKYYPRRPGVKYDFNDPKWRRFNIACINDHYFIKEKIEGVKNCYFRDENDRVAKMCKYETIQKGEQKGVLGCVKAVNTGYKTEHGIDVYSTTLIKHLESIGELSPFDREDLEVLTKIEEIAPNRVVTKVMNIDFEPTLYESRSIKGSIKFKTKGRSASPEAPKGEIPVENRIYFADFETQTNVIIQGKINSTRHKFQLAVLSDYKGEKITNHYHIRDFLESIPDKSIVYFHNLSYDKSFLFEYDGLLLTSIIGKNANKIKSFIGIFDDKKHKIKKRIYFRDSLLLLNFGIAKFIKTFESVKKLGYRKEIMPFNHYNKIYSYEEGFGWGIDVEEFKQICMDECGCTYKEITQSILDSKTIYKVTQQSSIFDASIGDRVNLKKYMEYYCRRDVEVLRLGFIEQRNNFLNILGIDIVDHLTNPAIAKAYVVPKLNSKIKEYKGTIVQYIQNAIIGGKCMLRNNTPNIQYQGPIESLDANSLYPTAMTLIGLPLGDPTYISTPTLSKLNTYSTYIAKIKVIKVGKPLPFPLRCIVSDKGNFFGNEDMEGQIITLSKIALEDCIKFQKYDFEILDAIYWNEGFDYSIGKVINYLYEQRNIYKRQKNPAQAIFKLIMNSIYGKFGQKIIATNMEIISRKQFDGEWLFNHFNKFQSAVTLRTVSDNERVVIKSSKSTMNQFSAGHLAVFILDMSKRLMNEVMCLANDNNIPIFYTDTDSMHLYKSDIPRLADLYDKEYVKRPEVGGAGGVSSPFQGFLSNLTSNDATLHQCSSYRRPLLGPDLGQFTGDFEVDSLIKCEIDHMPIIKDPNTRPYSSCFIGISKKFYLDIIRYYDKESGMFMKGLLCKCKGVPKAIIDARYDSTDRISFVNGKSPHDDVIEAYLSRYKVAFQSISKKEEKKLTPYELKLYNRLTDDNSSVKINALRHIFELDTRTIQLSSLKSRKMRFDLANGSKVLMRGDKGSYVTLHEMIKVV